jgi:phage-related protein
MMVYAYNTSEDFRVIVDGVFAWVGEAAGRLSAAWSTTMTSMGAILGWFQDAVGRFGAAWDQTMRSFADIVGWAGGVVDSVFAWIGGSATRFSESWAQTTDSISRMFRAVGDGFVWVYDNIIKPMFDGFLRFVGDVVHGLGIAWGALKEAFMAPVRSSWTSCGTRASAGSGTARRGWGSRSGTSRWSSSPPVAGCPVAVDGRTRTTSRPC